MEKPEGPLSLCTYVHAQQYKAESHFLPYSQMNASLHALMQAYHMPYTKLERERTLKSNLSYGMRDAVEGVGGEGNHFAGLAYIF